jgi:uncharacterized protein (TIGR04255 family)
MASYVPAVGDHAVQEAVLGIRLFEPATDAAYENALATATTLASTYNLPGRLKLDPISLVMGRQSISAGYAATEVMPGVLYQRVSPSGDMEEELTVERSAVTYRTRSYKRWADVVRLIHGILIPVMESLSANAKDNISVLELRCIDQFVSDGDAPPALSDLVRSGSGFVPSHLLDKTELLHARSGWFENQTESSRTLINVNIDLSTLEDGRRSASILQMISLQGATSGNLFDADRSLGESILKIFDALHRRDKTLLAGILTDKLQSEINLIGSSGIDQ